MATSKLTPDDSRSSVNTNDNPVVQRVVAQVQQYRAKRGVVLSIRCTQAEADTIRSGAQRSHRTISGLVVHAALQMCDAIREEEKQRKLNSGVNSPHTFRVK